jgi:hypothetical protein
MQVDADWSKHGFNLMALASVGRRRPVRIDWSIQPPEFFGNSKRQIAERGWPVHLERRPVWRVTSVRLLTQSRRELRRRRAAVRFSATLRFSGVSRPSPLANREHVDRRLAAPAGEGPRRPTLAPIEVNVVLNHPPALSSTQRRKLLPDNDLQHRLTPLARARSPAGVKALSQPGVAGCPVEV